MTQKAPVALIILDGFGYRKDSDYNAIAQAKTPHFDEWFAKYPHTLLQASGTTVGLPEGYIGNSEVGHMTIGAGRVVKQSLIRINEAVDNGSFFTNSTLTTCLEALRNGSNRLHIMGLLSDAGVHCLTKHIIAYIRAAQEHGIKHIFIHPFLDGRDAAPQSAALYLTELETAIQNIGAGIIGSLHGRFFVMDRNKNWDRTEISYYCLTTPAKPLFPNWQAYLNEHYNERISDEFMPPALMNTQAVIQSGDGIICANFRPDRSRQITSAFITPDFKPFKTSVQPLWYFTPVSYATDLPTKTLLPLEEPLKETFADVLHAHHKRFFAIAETEKYAHVTYFFNGGREKPYATETQLLVPSLVVHNYIEHPGMSAEIITDSVLSSLTSDPCDVYLINYANADMVGHSGNLEATTKAIEILDHEVARLYDQLVTKMGGTIYLTADHGNAELMFDPVTRQAKTAHTTNPVPFIVLGTDTKTLTLKSLADIAPFILTKLELAAPKAMQKRH
jgi:2,3-bisphosphoglycerate-independent phosphoglycerate mutase